MKTYLYENQLGIDLFKMTFARYFDAAKEFFATHLAFAGRLQSVDANHTLTALNGYRLVQHCAARSTDLLLIDNAHIKYLELKFLLSNVQRTPRSRVG